MPTAGGIQLKEKRTKVMMMKSVLNKTSIFKEYYDAQQKLEAEYGERSVVLMMVGDFYEIYGVDLQNTKTPLRIGCAEEVHNILGMRLTLKSKAKPHSVNNPQMVGFPEYALEEHLGKLLRAGMTVAIYDQYNEMYTTKSGKKSTRKARRRTQVYTPSTFIDDTEAEMQSLLTFELTTFTSPITKKVLKKAHIAVLAISTGKSYLLEVYDTSDDTQRVESELYRIIHTYNPREIIYCGEKNNKIISTYELGNKKVYFRKIPKSYRKASYQEEFLRKIYNVESLAGPIEYLGLEKHTSVIPHFIHALQFAFEQNKLILTKIDKPTFIRGSEQLILNNDSIYQLNLIKTPGEAVKSLYDIICMAKTAMGKRLIRERLLLPTTNIEVLEKRYDLIEQISFKEYEDYLRGIVDIQKKYRKMVLKTLQPYELADLYDTFDDIKKLLFKGKKLFGISKKTIKKYICFHNEYTGNFDFSVMRKCRQNDIKGTFFIEGVNERLDSIEESILAGKRTLYKLAQQFSDLIEPNKDSIVKVKSTDKEGWYLETTKTRFNKISKDFKISFDYHGKTYTIVEEDLEITRLKNSVKIRSPGIRRVSSDILRLRSTRNDHVLEEYYKVLDHYVDDYGKLFSKISDIIGEIDFTFSAAKVSKLYGYTRPTIVNRQKGASFIDVSGVRHPIIERINENQEYTTNDISIGHKKHYGDIIYGLNMSGKSSLLKSIGCNIVMAQAGLFVSCERLEFYPFSHLLSKMTIRDNMAKGQSTYLVELLEIKNMLQRADENTLVLSDELCSSTESTSGHAVVAQTLYALTKKKARFMFSTHLHELQKIPQVVENKHIKIFHFKVHIDEQNNIVFDRHLEEGGMTDLYGLEVARAVDLPDDFMRGAFEIRDQLLGESSEILPTKESRYNKGVYMKCCEVCGSRKNLQTHHLKHQKDADDYGLINKKFHKNAKFNLQVICQDCHIKEHHHSD